MFIYVFGSLATPPCLLKAYNFIFFHTEGSMVKTRLVREYIPKYVRIYAGCQPTCVFPILTHSSLLSNLIVRKNVRDLLFHKQVTTTTTTTYINLFS